MSELLTHVIPRSVWYGWGDPSEARPLPDAAWHYLRREIGADRAVSTPPIGLGDVVLPPSRLIVEGEGTLAVEALAAVVGTEHVHTDRLWRVEHAGGKSYPDLHRVRTGDGSQAPDAVVTPGSAGEVAAVVEVCERHRLAVVPFGGGTSVVGGVGAAVPPAPPPRPYAAEPAAVPFRGVVTVDLRRLDRVVAVDSVALTATMEPGLRGPEIERALHPHGLTLGHYPQSHQEATLGGYVATRSAGQASSGYGRIDDNVLGVRLATPRGELVLGGRSPASAAGPDLLDLVVGSEGTLGVITEATLRVWRLPTARRHAALLFPSFEAGAEALRHLAQDLGRGVQPDVCRLSDEDETRVNLTLSGAGGRRLLRYARLRGLNRPALLVLVWEGADPAELRHREHLAQRAIARFQTRRLPRQVGRAWEAGRFTGPYLRDELMDHGILADTLETATTWNNLVRLHAAAGGAIRAALEVDGRRAIVMCHVSHVYGTGASLYYTFIAPEGPEPLSQWGAVKAAASQAILAAGGTISHHHGVGSDHKAYLEQAIGPLGAALLRAVKAELDPTGILNPGKLVP